MSASLSHATEADTPDATRRDTEEDEDAPVSVGKYGGQANRYRGQVVRRKQRTNLLRRAAALPLLLPPISPLLLPPKSDRQVS
jgi:hypothetical protein